jgi:hypothetical protein
VKEYEIFVPLYYNDGTPVEARKLRDLQYQLLDEFGGLTFTPYPHEGYWRMGAVTFRDAIIIFRVIASREKSARRFLTKLKAQLRRSLRQEEILIVERDVKTL